MTVSYAMIWASGLENKERFADPESGTGFPCGKLSEIPRRFAMLTYSG